MNNLHNTYEFLHVSTIPPTQSHTTNTFNIGTGILDFVWLK